MKIKSFELFLESLNRNEIIVETISNEADKNITIDIVANQFSDFLEYDESVEYINDVTDWNISKIAKDSHGNVLAVLLLGDTFIHRIMEENDFTQLKNLDLTGVGLEGVALVVLEEYRNKNSFIVYKLFKSIDDLNFDYITIQQYENMPNTMNYENKSELLGYFYEHDIKVNVYYMKK